MDNTLKIKKSVVKRTNGEQRKLADLVEKSWTYLDSNFHKFDKKTRTHIALEIVKKAMPQKLEHTADNELIEAIRQSKTENLRSVLSLLQ